MYQPGCVVFENWTVTKKIGAGGFGQVYALSRDDFGVTYHSALKVIRVPHDDAELRSLAAEGMTPEAMEQYYYNTVKELVHEFEIMARLKATGHVVSYEDHRVIKHADGIGWDILIRMELLEPVLEHAYQHPFSRRDVIRLGIDICKALELCQKYDIIHRDVKPENIFVSPSGAFKLGDFGISRSIERTMVGLSKKGTYSYMAPEVYKGEGYGFTVDTYSLGIVLYRLLNRNRTPFLPEPPAPIDVRSREAALMKRFRGDPIPLPYYAKGRLGEIVVKACSYRSEQRYSSPIQMRQELEAILYDADDTDLIYPEGDRIRLVKNEYVSGSATKVTDVSETDTRQTVLEVSPPIAEHTPATRCPVPPCAPASIPQERKPKRKKSRAAIAAVVALLLVCGLLACLGGVYVLHRKKEAAAEAEKRSTYLSYLEEATQCRDSDPQKALQLIYSAQALFPEEEAPYVAYAYTLYSSRQYALCIEYIDEHLGLGKQFSVDTQNQLCEIMGAAYFELGDYAQAASFFRLSTGGESASVSAMRDYAVSLGRLGDVAAADSVLEKMRQAGAAGSVMTYVQAEIDYALGSYLLAEEGFRSAMGSASDAELQRRALRSLAELYRDCNALEKAGTSPIRGCAQKETELLLWGIDAFHLQYDATLIEMLAEACYEAADGSADSLEQSALYYEQLLSMGVEKDYLYTNLYTIYYELGDYTRAAQALERYIARFPSDYQPHALRAILLISMENEKDPALRDYRQAQKEYEMAGYLLLPSDDQTYYQLLESIIRQLQDNGWL